MPVASPADILPSLVEFDSVGSGLSSQLASSSRVSSPVFIDSACGASGMAGSLSKPGEVSTLMGPALSSMVPPLFSPEMLS